MSSCWVFFFCGPSIEIKQRWCVCLEDKQREQEWGTASAYSTQADSKDSMSGSGRWAGSGTDLATPHGLASTTGETFLCHNILGSVNPPFGYCIVAPPSKDMLLTTHGPWTPLTPGAQCDDSHEVSDHMNLTI